MRGFPLVPAVLSLFFLAVLEGCAPRGLSNAFDAPDDALVLRVINHNYDDVRVYLVRGSARIPVGRVASMELRTFRLAPSVAPSGAPAFRLMAEPFAGPLAFTTHPWQAHDGALVEWTLAHDLKHSTLTIR